MVHHHIIYTVYSDWTFDFARAEGEYLWTKDKRGKKLIDFSSGWNVTNLGWNHPEIAEYVIKQVKKSTYAPIWSADPVQDELADLLTKSLPKGLEAVGRATGGTEANEEALKTARAFTGRKKILGFKDTYHGQSFGTLSIGYLPQYVETISPLVGGFVQMDFPKMFGQKKSEKEVLDHFTQELERALSSEQIAAIITEAGIITGWGTTDVAPKGFLTVVRKLTKKYGTLLILDEVGTGFSRCGKLFGMEIEGVTPDIVTFAKGFSNGVAPIGAMVTTNEIAERTYAVSNIISTFGWTPVACAAALKTLQIHLRDKVWEKAKRDGEYLLSSLKQELKGNSKVVDVRGIGMEIGVTFAAPGMAKQIVSKTRVKGLHLAPGDEVNVQIMPPLTIERKTLQEGIHIFIETVNSL